MIINANALSIPLADKSVHMIVTSPPYWGLRDYGTAKWEGGDEGCDHKQATARNDGGRENIDGFHGSSRTDSDKGAMNYRSICGKCGAIRIDNQLGLERTPEEYIANMVVVFRECWRVLRDDGTCWVNIGDSYAGSGGHSPDSPSSQPEAVAARGGFGVFDGRLIKGNHYSGNGIKPKDLVGIPWRLAFALQANGWYLRSDIIWNKPNPMPESVTDRPTKSHEYLFLLAKQERYYYDCEAIKEESIRAGDFPGGDNERGKDEFGVAPHAAFNGVVPTGRNRRTVWTIPTAPYKGAHFATFPPALVEPCIKAGTSERGVCPKCGKGWRRIVNKSGGTIGESWHNHENDLERGMRGGDNGHNKAADLYKTYKVETAGWQPSCTCGQNNGGPLEPIPAIVFDPFVGSGTTVKVAYDLGRRGVGLDLSLEYLSEQATTRIHNGHTGRLL